MSNINYLSNTKNMTTIEKLSKGVNGTTYIIKYADNRTKALLKMAKNKYNDNLMYEYLVGKDYINMKIGSSNPPVFVKTHALFKYNYYKKQVDNYDNQKKEYTKSPEYKTAYNNYIQSDDYRQKNILNRMYDYFSIKNKLLLEKFSETKFSPVYCVEDENPIILKEDIKYLQLIDKSNNSTPFNYADICDCNQNFALLVEYIDGSKSLNNYFQNINYNFYKTLSILTKIYNALSNLYPNFVHNDLTLENVLVDANGNPKIIDYGRCYFNTEKNSSKKILEQVNENCSDEGIDNGFADIWNRDREKTKKGMDSFMNQNCGCENGQQYPPVPPGICKLDCISCRNNKDLRLLYDLNEKYTTNDQLKNLLNRVILSQTRSPSGNLESYCDDSFKLEEGRITTIQQAKTELDKLMSSQFPPNKIPAPSGGSKKYTRRVIKHNKKKKSRQKKSRNKPRAPR